MKMPNEEIANSLDKWLEYVCGNNDAEINTEWFHSMSFKERMDYLVTTWGE
jgi:hypothetical protein